MNKDRTGRDYKPKETVLVITVAFLLVYILFHRKIALYLSLTIGLSGILSSFLAEKIDWFWTKLSKLLGAINNCTLLTILFFIVLTPMGLIRRLLKRSNLGGAEEGKTSSFQDRDHLYTARDLENTW